jgi:hypothetical protein
MPCEQSFFFMPDIKGAECVARPAPHGRRAKALRPAFFSAFFFHISPFRYSPPSLTASPSFPSFSYPSLARVRVSHELHLRFTRSSVAVIPFTLPIRVYDVPVVLLRRMMGLVKCDWGSILADVFLFFFRFPIRG